MELLEAMKIVTEHLQNAPENLDPKDIYYTKMMENLIKSDLIHFMSTEFRLAACVMVEEKDLEANPDSKLCLHYMCTLRRCMLEFVDVIGIQLMKATEGEQAFIKPIEFFPIVFAFSTMNLLHVLNPDMLEAFNKSLIQYTKNHPDFKDITILIKNLYKNMEN